MHRHPGPFNCHRHFPQWGTADAEIKVISAETTIGSFRLKKARGSSECNNVLTDKFIRRYSLTRVKITAM